MTRLTRRDGDDRSAEEILNTFVMIANSNASKVDDRYDRFFTGLNELKTVLTAAVNQFKAHAYLPAHMLFGQALNSDQAGELKREIVYDYLVSGYVGYSLKSDTVGIRELIREAQSEYAPYIAKSAAILLAEAHQEVATRQLSDEMLLENSKIVSQLLAKYGIDDEPCQNLEGMLYKRLGERVSSGDRRLSFLSRANSVFERISSGHRGTMPVEYCNNWAITLVRLFELNKDQAALAKAEEILLKIDHEVENIALTDFLCLPKALNNTGNVFKQKMDLTREVEHYASAIENYVRAERYWDEKRSPYEWAMIQKNKADVRCRYMKLFGFRAQIAQQALEEIEASLRYRSPEAAPYQYRRSMDVKGELEALIGSNSR